MLTIDCHKNIHIPILAIWRRVQISKAIFVILLTIDCHFSYLAAITFLVLDLNTGKIVHLLQPTFSIDVTDIEITPLSFQTPALPRSAEEMNGFRLDFRLILTVLNEWKLLYNALYIIMMSAQILKHWNSTCRVLAWLFKINLIIEALYHILLSPSLLSHLLLVPYNSTVKEVTYIHMTRMNNLYLSITKQVIFSLLNHLMIFI